MRKYIFLEITRFHIDEFLQNIIPLLSPSRILENWGERMFENFGLRLNSIGPTRLEKEDC